MAGPDMNETKSKAVTFNRPTSVPRARQGPAGASTSYPPFDSGRAMNQGNETMNNFKDQILRDVDRQTTEVYQNIEKISEGIQEFRQVFEKAQVQSRSTAIDMEEVFSRISEHLAIKQDLQVFEKEVRALFDGLRTEVNNICTSAHYGDELLGALERIYEIEQERGNYPPGVAVADLTQSLIEPLTKELHKLFGQHFATVTPSLRFLHPCEDTASDESSGTREAQTQTADNFSVRDSSDSQRGNYTNGHTRLSMQDSGYSSSCTCMHNKNACPAESIPEIVSNELRQLFDEHFGRLSSLISSDGRGSHPNSTSVALTLEAELAPFLAGGDTNAFVTMTSSDATAAAEPPVDNHVPPSLISSSTKLFAKVQSFFSALSHRLLCDASFWHPFTIITGELAAKVKGMFGMLSIREGLSLSDIMLRRPPGEQRITGGGDQSVAAIAKTQHFLHLLTIAIMCIAISMTLGWDPYHILLERPDHPLWAQMRQMSQNDQI